MKTGSETKIRRRIRLAGALAAVLAGQIFLFPAVTPAETIYGSSMEQQMESLIRKSGEAAGSAGTMSEVVTGAAASTISGTAALPGLVYDAAGRIIGYSNGTGTSQSVYNGSTTPGSYSGNTYPGNTYSNPPSAGTQSSAGTSQSSPGYILDGRTQSTSTRVGSTKDTSTTTRSSGKATGPAADLAAAAARGEVTLENSVNSNTTAQNGPTVTEITLRENRFDDYGIYSEAMSDSLFIYSTVSNNSITDQPVILEYPAQMSCSAEKDGIPFTYTSGTAVSEYGTYVMKFRVVSNPGAPVISQNVLQSIFTFRIREKTPEAKAAEAAAQSSPFAPGSLASLSSGIAPGSSSIPETQAPETAPAETEPAVTEPAVTEPAETEPEPAAEPEKPMAKNEFYRQEYDTATELYRITLPDGRSFTSTVPNGFLSPYAVDLDLSGLAGIEGVRLLENGEDTAVKEQMSLNYAGSYTLLIPTSGGTAPFSVKLPGEKVRKLGSYTVPDGVKVVSMTKNGRNVPGADTADVLDFSEDAVYALKLEDMAGSKYDVAFEVDSEAPQFTVTVGKGDARITYLSEDVAAVALTKSDGTTFRYDAPISTVNEPGSYRITVMDEAGNRSTDTFTIKKRINPATPIAVILLLGFIGGGIFFFRRTRQNTKVR